MSASLRPFCAAAILTILGCTADTPIAPSVAPDFLVATMPQCNTTVAYVSFFTPRRPCGDQIRIGPAAGSEAYAGEIAAAANAWNDALVDPRVPGIPLFIPGAGLDVQVVVNGATGPYCGEGVFSNGAPWGVVTLHTAGCAGKNTSNLTTTLTHELSHVLGLLDNAERLGQAGVSDGCTTSLNQDLTINALVCQHDVEMVYAAYGQRGAEPLPTDFWSRVIVTGLNPSPESITVSAQGQAAVMINSLRFDRAGGFQAGGGQFAPPAGDSSLVGIAFVWATD